MAGGICHWGPLVALSIIITLFLAGLYCTLLWFPPWTSVASVIHVAVFISWLALIMNYFLKSIWLGPGYLPLGWRMVSVNWAANRTGWSSRQLEIKVFQSYSVCRDWCQPELLDINHESLKISGLQYKLKYGKTWLGCIRHTVLCSSKVWTRPRVGCRISTACTWFFRHAHFITSVGIFLLQYMASGWGWNFTAAYCSARN